MTYEEFTVENLKRCEAFTGFNHKIDSWSESDWMTATMGELGELANIVKKLNRFRDGIPGNTETKAQLLADAEYELADVFIYLDLLARRLKMDMMAVVTRKFARTSAKIGYLQ